MDRGDKLPLGLPKLMMGFTADGQLDPAVVATRDREGATTAAQLKAQRAGIPTQQIAPGADAWQTGRTLQIDDALLKQTPPAPKPQR